MTVKTEIKMFHVLLLLFLLIKLNIFPNFIENNLIFTPYF